ncbi:MAG: signal recognition particle protein [Chloroflexota bacterium]|jgi:signal recognition particle subunit SRP54|nr:signal recognition particle protein [Chloroflexota bacterium]
MFESLTDRLQGIFGGLQKRGRLSEEDVDGALKEVRLALLEADVHFRVARDFIKRVRERAVGSEVSQSLTPAQVVLKIVNDELVETLGGQSSRLDWTGVVPAPILMVGLNGQGKTTSSAKLAVRLRKMGQRPFMIACDTFRPAAIQQLVTLGKQVGCDVYEEGSGARPVDIALRGIAWGRDRGHTVAIVDTAGRQQVDEALMDELVDIRQAISPTEILLVASAMTGQEAVNVAQVFHDRLRLTGLVLTQIDGDARGGAALSIRAVTGIPVKFLGVGEKIEALTEFHPDRIASRILGMGDMLTLIEQTQDAFDQEEATKLQKKLLKGQFTFDDFLGQMQQVRKMGSLQSILEMIPGLNQLTKRPEIAAALDERQFKRVEAIIQSMTAQERALPQVIDGSRRRRIATGSGTKVQDVNQLLNQFREMQGMMKQMSRGTLPRNLSRMMRRG